MLLHCFCSGTFTQMDVSIMQFFFPPLLPKSLWRLSLQQEGTSNISGLEELVHFCDLLKVSE